MEHNNPEEAPPPPLPEAEEADLDAWLAQGGDADDSSDGEDEYGYEGGSSSSGAAGVPAAATPLAFPGWSGCGRVDVPMPKEPPDRNAERVCRPKEPACAYVPGPGLCCESASAPAVL